MKRTLGSKTSSALTAAEKKRLATLETVICDSLQDFVDVGRALAEIKTTRLHRSDYSTFEEYCRMRWDFGRAHAYRLIDCAQVVECVSPMGDILPKTERQARELTIVRGDDGRLDTCMLRRLWKLVKEEVTEGKGLTSSLIRKVVRQTLGPQYHCNAEPGARPASTVEPLIASTAGNRLNETPSITEQMTPKLGISVESRPLSTVPTVDVPGPNSAEDIVANIVALCAKLDTEYDLTETAGVVLKGLLFSANRLEQEARTHGLTKASSPPAAAPVCRPTRYVPVIQTTCIPSNPSPPPVQPKDVMRDIHLNVLRLDNGFRKRLARNPDDLVLRSLHAVCAVLYGWLEPEVITNLDVLSGIEPRPPRTWVKYPQINGVTNIGVLMPGEKLPPAVAQLVSGYPSRLQKMFEILDRPGKKTFVNKQQMRLVQILRGHGDSKEYILSAEDVGEGDPEPRVASGSQA